MEILTKGCIACGQVVGRIKEIKSIAEIVEDIMTEAEQVIKRLNCIIKRDGE